MTAFNKEQYMPAFSSLTKETLLLWQTVLNSSVEPPMYPEDIAARMEAAQQTNVPVTIFVPWGINPNCTYSNAQDEGLQIVQRWSDRIKQAGVPNSVLLMPADLYATEINGMNPQAVQIYVELVSRKATSNGFIVRPWSKIRSEKLESYSRKKFYFRPELISKTFPQKILFDAVEAARERSMLKDEESIRNATLAYIQERLVEAEIIEEQFKPIKLSMVSAKKDVFDTILPRIYVIPPEKRFPWLR